MLFSAQTDVNPFAAAMIHSFCLVGEGAFAVNGRPDAVLTTKNCWG